MVRNPWSSLNIPSYAVLTGLTEAETARLSEAAHIRSSMVTDTYDSYEQLHECW